MDKDQIHTSYYKSQYHNTTNPYQGSLRAHSSLWQNLVPGGFRTEVCMCSLAGCWICSQVPKSHPGIIATWSLRTEHASLRSEGESLF